MLLAKITVVALGTVLLRVTVQVVVWPVLNVAGEQLSDIGTAGAIIPNANVAAEPLALAVIVADWFAGMDPTLTANVPDVEPPGTVTLAGTAAFALLLRTPTINPAPGAVPFKVTVHVAVPGAFTVEGLQLRLLGANRVG